MASYNYPFPAYNQPYNPMQTYPPPMYTPPQQMPQTPPQAQQQGNQGLSGASRPVTNREEAVSTPADFSGALMVFPDLSNNRIYLKRWNMQTGAADFCEFAPVIPASAEQKAEQPAAFASLREFQDLQGTVESLQREVERLKRPVGKTVKKNDPSDE